MSDFPNAPVTVTLTGEEWTAIMVRFSHGKNGLSDQGCELYRQAARKLSDQVAAASDTHRKGVQMGPRLIVANSLKVPPLSQNTRTSSQPLEPK